MATTRTLILMRHASAGGGAHRDHDRPLTPGGSQDAAAAGNWIRDQLPPVDAVVCSTAVRARQTLAATRISAAVTFADELYGGGIDDILEQIALIPESAGTALVVGHAPGIPSVAFELATIARLVRENGASPHGSADGDSGSHDPSGNDPSPSDPSPSDPSPSDPSGDDPSPSDPSGDQDGQDGPGEQPELAGLRHFSSGAMAVLTTDASWAQIGDHGADLVAVRHPDR